MKVVFVGQLEKWRDAPDHLGVRQGWEQLGVDFYSIEVEDEWGYEEVNDINPDLVIHGNTDSLSSWMCKFIRPDAVQVFCQWDYRTPGVLISQEDWNSWTTNGPYLDLITVPSLEQQSVYAKEFGVPVEVLPHGCWVPPALDYKAEHDYDVLFIGSQHNEGSLAQRTELLREIDDLLQFRLGIRINWINETDIEARNKIWSDMSLLYHSSKVVLDISHFWEDTYYASGRYWYSATFGACCISKRFPGCEEFFEDRKHKLYFDTAKEAVDRIEEAFSDVKLRSSLKQEVAEYAWKEHNYANRWTQLLDWLGMGWEKERSVAR